MGVDTVVRLSPEVQVRDVADVIGFLLVDKPKTWTDCTDHNAIKTGLKEPTNHGWTHFEGITFTASDTQPECVTINIPGVGGEWWFCYHFEGEGGQRLMMGSSRAERIALHRRLAQFFGGTVDYSDCDATAVDYSCPAPSWMGKKDNDKHFHALQLAKWAIEPITQKEIKECRKWAAYK